MGLFKKRICLLLLIGFLLPNIVEYSVDAADGIWKKNDKGWWYAYTKGAYAQNEWVKIKDRWYYFDARGYMVTGWKKLSNRWYYFEKTGAMKTGWKKLSSRWYYLRSDGSMQTGWKKISSKWYYFRANGSMQTGWKKISSSWYYFGSNGAMTTGWRRIASSWYYFGSNGDMKNGWQTIGGRKYYFNSNGVMQTGWQIIGGKKYYFTYDGTMAVGAYSIDGKEYIFDENGGFFENKYKIPAYYFEKEYLTDRVSTILEHNNDIGGNGDQFIWITDMHLWCDTLDRIENGMQSTKLINYLSDQTGIDKVFFGGDAISGNTMPKKQAVGMMSEFVRYMSQIRADTYMIYGNHEGNNPGNTEEQKENELKADECYALFCKKMESKYGSLSVRGDYWIDNTTQNIRYFFLNCKSNSTIAEETEGWLGKQLMEVPDGYTVVVLSHLGIDYSDSENAKISKGLQRIEKLLDALNVGKMVTINGVSYDFTGKSVDVACVISGHIHRDCDLVTEGGIPVIATTCDRAARSTSSDLFYEVRKIGTIGEQAFDVVQIDKSKKKIYMTRIGGSIIDAAYDSATGRVYDVTAGNGKEYTGSEWVRSTPYKDREYSYSIQK